LNLDVHLVTSSKELGEVARFMVASNSLPESQIAYCAEDDVPAVIASLEGSQKQPIQVHTLGPDGVPADGMTVAARNEDCLIGAFALDCGREVKRAWLWGPFVHPGSDSIADHMWSLLEPQLPDFVEELEMFFNVRNLTCARFGARHGFVTYKETVSVMRMARRTDTYSKVALESKEAVPRRLVEDVTVEHYSDVAALHHRLFPRTWLPAASMFEGLDDRHRAMMIKDSGQVVAYVYGEVESEQHSGSVLYVGVSESHRGRGLGTLLTQELCKWIFSHKEIEEIILSVDADKPSAKHIYEKLGFQLLFDACALTRPRYNEV
jgi:ribosomal protein S18 acetylase RimI-like enzyme